MAGPVHVFISYSSKDRPIVKRLMEDLKQAGVEVWFDHEQLKPGTRNWTAAVRRGIEQATDVIYAASPDAANSVYVGHELAIARDEGNEDHIVPFWVRGEKWSRCVPFGYYYAQYIDGRDVAYAAGLAKLLATLGVANTAPTASSYRGDSSDYKGAEDETDTWEPIQRYLMSAPSDPQAQELVGSLLRQHAEANARPNVIPIGARFGAMEADNRLLPATTHRITVENAGESAVSHIFAVLFPSVTYFNSQGMSQGSPPLWGTYWEGRVGVGLAPRARCEIPLEETRWPLVGDLRVAPQYALYAPIQPPPEERRAGNAHFYSARLTITCRDTSGTRFATVFDLDADRLAQNRDDIWDQIMLSQVVEQDLRELTAEWEKKRQPPRLGS